MFPYYSAILTRSSTISPLKVFLSGSYVSLKWYNHAIPIRVVVPVIFLIFNDFQRYSAAVSFVDHARIYLLLAKVFDLVDVQIFPSSIFLKIRYLDRERLKDPTLRFLGTISIASRIIYSLALASLLLSTYVLDDDEQNGDKR